MRTGRHLRAFAEKVKAIEARKQARERAREAKRAADRAAAKILHCRFCGLVLKRLKREWCDYKCRARAVRYGLNLEQLNRLRDAAGGQCRICELYGMPLVVDLYHGKVRGLLCRRCNSALGLLGNDEGTIKRAAHYVAQCAKRR